jgi:hypothetical protein
MEQLPGVSLPAGDSNELELGLENIMYDDENQELIGLNRVLGTRLNESQKVHEILQNQMKTVTTQS